MALIINEECINCAACEPECPNTAIAEGQNIYIINPDLCTECVGFHDEPKCITVCPVDCIVKDPNHEESKDQLMAKFKKLHP